MAKRKKPNESLAAPLSAFAGTVRKIPTELLLGVALIALLAVGAVYGWQKWGEPITQQERFQLSADSIDVTPQPSWIRSDIKAEASRDGSLDGLSIFDRDLTVRIYRAFEMQAWVERVNFVSKRPPRVRVDLDYRRPVAWVEVPTGLLPTNYNYSGLLAIDAAGVLLPDTDFAEVTTEQTQDYVRIVVTNLTPCGLVGAPWGDPRVASAARIAALIADHVRQVGFHRIVVKSRSGGATTPDRTTYELTTRNGIRFLWGSPPGQETSGEPTASQKTLRAIQIASEAVTDGSIEGQEVDLRAPLGSRSKQRTANLEEDPSY